MSLYASNEGLPERGYRGYNAPCKFIASCGKQGEEANT